MTKVKLNITSQQFPGAVPIVHSCEVKRIV